MNQRISFAHASASTPPANASLGYKLKPPLPSATQVWRAAANALMDAPGCAAKLVLIRAPAGFGKTTLMLQHRSRLQERASANAWLTLDSADNDATRFVSFLAQALSGIGTGAAEPAPTAPGTVETLEVHSQALQVIDSLARLTVPITLFLDEFEAIKNSAVIQLTRQIIEHLPAGSQLIIATRNLPELGLGRLRARGQLLEIEPEQLRFSLEEVSAFMHARLGALLKPKELARLHRTTEGWVAALWLASVALEHQPHAESFIDKFSGSNKSVANYLAEDVLGNLPTAQRDFLLRTSILSQLNAPLCDALCGRGDSHQTIQQLDDRGLFLIPLNQERTLYRYHNLFADFLSTQLDITLPGERARLHRAAAIWYQGAGRPVPAIDHAIASGDSGYAGALLDEHASGLLTEGRARLLSRWLDAMPAATLAQHPGLRVIHAWALTFTHRHTEAMTLLDHLEADQSLDSDGRDQVLAMRPTLLGMMDRVPEAYSAARENLPKIKVQNTFAYSLLANSMATLMTSQGQYEAARALLDRARQSHAEINSKFSMVIAECVEGQIDLAKGNLRQATARFRTAVDLTGHGHGPNTPGNALAGIQLAQTLYEADQCGQAERLLNVCVPLGRDIAMPDQMISGYVTLSRIAYNRNDVDMAFQYLNELEQLGHRQRLSRLVASARLERARIALCRDDPDLAREELQRSRVEGIWQAFSGVSAPANDIETVAVSALRIMIRSGGAKEALPQIKFELQQANAQQRLHRALKLKILLAEALRRLNQPVTALRKMREALLFASREGFSRIFLDEGAQVIKLIQEVRATEPGSATPADGAFTVYLDRLLDAISQAPRDGTDASPAPLAQALTLKELGVLELLTEGLTNKVMSERLFVSETTVRTHLRNIYTKLEAHSRTQAISIARSHRLIR